MTRTTGGRHRRVQEEAIVAELRRSGALGRSELGRRASVPRASVYAIVADLVERRLVVEQRVSATGAREPRQRGRPGTLVSLNPSAGVLVGVDLGRQRARTVIANLSHQVIATGEDEVPSNAEPEQQVGLATDLVRRVAAEREVDLADLESVGVGIPGIIGAHVESAALRGLSARLEREFGARVHLANNSRLAALAEATWGAGRGAANVVYVRWSVGVGGGLVVGGQALAGSHSAAGEIGHISLDPDGKPCRCGGRGCLELRIGGPALVERCASRGLALEGLDGVVAAARSRVPVACGVVEEAAAVLGQVLAACVVQFDPDRVVIGGEVAQLGTLVLDGVKGAIRRLAIPNSPRRVEVVPADLGLDAAALGAVALMLQERGQDTSLPEPGRD